MADNLIDISSSYVGESVSAPSWLRRVLSHPYAPPILYHYTSHTGLIGILKARKLWATNILSLNDQREFRLAREIAATSAEDFAKGAGRPALAKLYRACAEGIEKVDAGRVYVTSLSEHSDQLSQWRAYCGGSNGYALGFATKRLIDAVAPRGFVLVRCEYDRDAQRHLVHAFLARIIQSAKAQQARTGRSAREHAARQASVLFPLLAPVLKDPSFSEEGEWRLIAPSVDPGTRGTSLRPGRSSVVPYLEIGWAPAGEDPELPEIVVGPAPDIEQTARAVHAAALHAGVRCMEVRQSRIPFRDW